MSSSTISSKGQVTVPQDIRKRLGLNEGDRVEFIVHGEHTIIRPARAENPFEDFVGALPAFPGGTKEIRRWVADMRDE